MGYAGHAARAVWLEAVFASTTFFFLRNTFFNAPHSPKKKIYSFTLRRQEEHIPPGFQRGPVELDPNDLAARA